MTRSDLLRCLCAFLEDATKDLIMPTALQKGDTEQGYRAAAIHQMRLPNGADTAKLTPYILVRVIHGDDVQKEGTDLESTAVIRMTFTVYCKDEPEGELMLLNLMERVRIALLKKVVIGDLYTLDLSDGLSCDVYDGIKAPYYAGEMVTTWQLPPIEREDVMECL